MRKEAQILEGLSQAYKDRFDEHAKFFVKAPGRINLIGEHTDYNGGWVFPAAIDKAIYFAFGTNQLQEVNIHSLDFNATRNFQIKDKQKTNELWINYIKGLLIEFHKLSNGIQGFNVVSQSTIPLGAGMSSSSAFECGIAKGIDQLFNLELSDWDIINMSHRSNHNYIGMKGGIMDQFACLFGESQSAMKLSCVDKTFDYVEVKTDPYQFVLINSSVKHDNLTSGYNDRAEECQTILAELRKHDLAINNISQASFKIANDLSLSASLKSRLNFVLTENQRVHEFANGLVKSDFKLLGKLLYQSHEGLSNSYEVSCNELDYLVALTKDYDEVLGARMMGGGFGGCTLNLIHKDKIKGVTQAIIKRYQQHTGLTADVYICEISEGLEIIK